MTDDNQPVRKSALNLSIAAIGSPLAADISPAADVHLRDALVAVTRRGADSRAALIKILEGMVLLTEDVLPEHAGSQLCPPVRELITELRELEVGRPPGPFTASEVDYRRPVDSLAEIERQAHAVLALRWLHEIGCKHGAALKIAEVIRTKPLSRSETQAREQARKEAKRVEGWSRYFAEDEEAERQRRKTTPPAPRHRDRDGRRADVIWEMGYELETAWWGDRGQDMDKATEQDVLDWLRATMHAPSA